MLIQSFLLLWAVLQTNPTGALGDACAQPNCTFEAFNGTETKTGICSDNSIKGYHDVGQQQCGNGCKCYSTGTIYCTASRNSPLKPIQDPDFCESLDLSQCPSTLGKRCLIKCKAHIVGCTAPWHFVKNEDSGDQCFQAINKELNWSAARVYCNHLGGGSQLTDLAVPKDNNREALQQYIITLFPGAAQYWIGGSDLYHQQEGVPKWTWIDGSDMMHVGVTTQSGECVYFKTKADASTPVLPLGNEGCGASLHFVCEKKLID